MYGYQHVHSLSVVNVCLMCEQFSMIFPWGRWSSTSSIHKIIPLDSGVGKHMFSCVATSLRALVCFPNLCENSRMPQVCQSSIVNTPKGCIYYSIQRIWYEKPPFSNLHFRNRAAVQPWSIIQTVYTSLFAPDQSAVHGSVGAGRWSWTGKYFSGLSGDLA